MMDIRPTSEAAGAYIWFGQDCLRRAHRTGHGGVKAIRDGRLLVICKYTTHHADLIVLPSDGGIIVHPRRGTIVDIPYFERIVVGGETDVVRKTYPGVAGGWFDGVTPLSMPYLFPLVDEDNASLLVSGTEQQQVEFLGDSSAYGNLYWTDGNSKDPKIVSFRGTPTRHFPLPSGVRIAGFSLHYADEEHAILGDMPLYTAFGTLVYTDGGAGIPGPTFSWPYGDRLDGRSLVYGAAISSDDVVYCVTRSDRRRAPENVFVFSDGYRLEGTEAERTSYLVKHQDVVEVFGKALPRTTREKFGGGVWVMLWAYNGGPIDGWTLVEEGEIDRKTPELPWFADATGIVFTCSNGDMISPSGFVAADSGQSGRFTVTAQDGYPVAVTASATVPLYSEPGVTLTGTFSVDASTSCTEGEKVYKDYAEDGVYVVGVDPDVTLEGPSVLSGTGTYPNRVASAGQKYFAKGTAPFSWSATFAGGPIYAGDSVFVTSGGDMPCGVGSITVTDACGKSASLDVRMPNGQWVKVPTTERPTFQVRGDEVINTYYYNGEYRYRVGNANIRWTVPRAASGTLDNSKRCEIRRTVGCHEFVMPPTHHTFLRTKTSVYNLQKNSSAGSPCDIRVSTSYSYLGTAYPRLTVINESGAVYFPAGIIDGVRCAHRYTFTAEQIYVSVPGSELVARNESLSSWYYSTEGWEGWRRGKVLGAYEVACTTATQFWGVEGCSLEHWVC